MKIEQKNLETTEPDIAVDPVLANVYITDKIYDGLLCKFFKRKAPCYKCNEGFQVSWVYRQWPNNNWTDDYHKNFNSEKEADQFMIYIKESKRIEVGF
jgi:hypothetical protein